MNWRAWFPQKEVFLIEGREVVLLNRTRVAFPEELKTSILSYCSQEKIVRSLPKVTFTLRSWDGALAQINNHQLQKRRLVIEINAGRIYGPESEQYWKRIIVHELTHLLHDYVSGTIRDYYSVSKMLDRSLIQLRKQKRIDFFHEDLRVLLFRLFRKVFIEGVQNIMRISSLGKQSFLKLIFKRFMKLNREG